MNSSKLNERIQEVTENKLKINNGEMKVLTAYNYSTKSTDSEILVFNRLIWESEYEDLLQSLKDYQIDEFIISDTSTGLMSILQFFLKNGYKIEGAKGYLNKDTFIPAEEPGLHIKLA